MISFEVWRGVDLFAEVNVIINILLLYLKRRGDKIYYDKNKYSDSPYESTKRERMCFIGILLACFLSSWFDLFGTVDVMNLEYEVIQGTVCDIGNPSKYNRKGTIYVCDEGGEKEKIEYVYYDLGKLNVGDEVEVIRIIRGSSQNLVMTRNGEYTAFYQKYAMDKEECERRVKGFLTRYIIYSSIFLLAVLPWTLKKHKKDVEKICFIDCRKTGRYLWIWGMLSVVYKITMAYLVFGECDMDLVKWLLVIIYAIEKSAFFLFIASRYQFVELWGAEVAVKDKGKPEKMYLRKECMLEKIGKGKYYRLFLAGQYAGTVSGKNVTVQNLLYGTSISEEKHMENISNITSQEIDQVREIDVQKYLEEKAAALQRTVRKMLMLLTVMSVAGLSALAVALDSPMRWVITGFYGMLYVTALMAGIYVEKSREKRIRNQKLSNVCKGEGIVISQKPLEVKYRDKDGVLKIAGNIQQNDAGKMELGKGVTITLEDGKLAKCRYKNM